MPYTSTKWSIPVPLGSELVSSIDDTLQDTADTLDDLLTPYDAGLLADRPTSTPGSPGKAGRFYLATDNGVLYQDTGTAWHATPTGNLTGNASGKAPVWDGSKWVATDVATQAELDAETDGLAGAWTPLFERAGALDSGISSGTTWVLGEHSDTPAQSGAAGMIYNRAFPINAADMTPSGRTMKVRVALIAASGSVTPNVTSIVAVLVPVASVTGAGVPRIGSIGATLASASTGHFAAGGTGIATPVYGTEATITGTDDWVLGIQVSSAPASPSGVAVAAVVERRFV